MFVKPNAPVLIHIARAIPVSDINSREIQSDIEQLLSASFGKRKDRAKPTLVGLAAPQIGISKRIIAVDIGADGKGTLSDLRIYINPEIIKKSTKKSEWYEGCWSTDKVCGIVSRAITVTIRAYTPTGNEVIESYSGYVARIFQHEIDHLNGIEFVQHIDNDNNLHWVEADEFPQYRNNEGWRTWMKKCPRKKWEIIKGIRYTKK